MVKMIRNDLLMTHLSHKLRWGNLKLDDLKSQEHFAKVFVNTLEEFKSTSSDKPNYNIPSWPDDTDNLTDTEIEDAKLHHPEFYELFEHFSMGGVITHLLRNYLAMNLLLSDSKYHVLSRLEPAYFCYDTLSVVLPGRMYDKLRALIEVDEQHNFIRYKHFDREQTTLAREYLKIVFRLFYRNLDYYRKDIGHQVLSELQLIQGEIDKLSI